MFAVLASIEKGATEPFPSQQVIAFRVGLQGSRKAGHSLVL